MFREEKRKILYVSAILWCYVMSLWYSIYHVCRRIAAKQNKKGDFLWLEMRAWIVKYNIEHKHDRYMIIPGSFRKKEIIKKKENFRP